MRRLFLLCAVILQILPGFGEVNKIDTVNCTISENMITGYLTDAQVLALIQIRQSNNTYGDSILIPSSHITPILQDLEGIYQAGLPNITDSIFNIYRIHADGGPDMTEFDLSVDTNQLWVKHLLAGSLLSGNDTVDALMNNYGLILQQWSTYPWGETDLSIWTSSNLNIRPLETAFAHIQGVLQASDGFVYFDGNRIVMNDSVTFREYIFTYGFDDCPSGCIGHHSWKFRIYPGCAVEYMGSYGTPLQTTTGIEPITSTGFFTIYPNPSSGGVVVKSPFNITNLKVFDILGRLVFENMPDKSDVNLNLERSGIYFVRIVADGKSITERLVINK